VAESNSSFCSNYQLGTLSHFHTDHECDRTDWWTDWQNWQSIYWQIIKMTESNPNFASKQLYNIFKNLMCIFSYQPIRNSL